MFFCSRTCLFLRSAAGGAFSGRIGILHRIGLQFPFPDDRAGDLEGSVAEEHVEERILADGLGGFLEGQASGRGDAEDHRAGWRRSIPICGTRSRTSPSSARCGSCIPVLSATWTRFEIITRPGVISTGDACGGAEKSHHCRIIVSFRPESLATERRNLPPPHLFQLFRR